MGAAIHAGGGAARACAVPARRDVRFDTELSASTQRDGGVTAQRGPHLPARRGRCAAPTWSAPTARAASCASGSARGWSATAALRNYSIIFRAPDLAARQLHGPAIMYWMVNADVPALLGPMDQHGLWFFMATKLPDDVDPPTVDPADLIRRGTGLRTWTSRSSAPTRGSRTAWSPTATPTGACSWPATPATCIRRSAASA